MTYLLRCGPAKQLLAQHPLIEISRLLHGELRRQNNDILQAFMGLAVSCVNQLTVFELWLRAKWELAS